MENEKINFTESVALRPAIFPDDEEFLIGLYYTTRDDIDQAPIDKNQKQQLSLMQYQAQKLHYESSFPSSRHEIILLDGKRIGRLWTARDEAEVLGIDLAILPEYRNCGIGSFLMRNLFDEAEQSERVFNLYVLKTNERAIKLYERLDCKYIDSDAITHFKMQWLPLENGEKR